MKERVGEKSWPYFLLVLRSGSYNMRQNRIPTDASMSHSSGDPLPSYCNKNTLLWRSQRPWCLSLCICLGPQHCNGPLKSMWVYEQTCLYTLEFSYLVRSFQVTEWRGMLTSVCPALGTVPEWNTVCWMNTWSQGRARMAGGRMIRNRECGWKDSLWSASIHCMYTFLRSTPTESRTFSLLLFIIPHSVSF